MQIHNLMNAVTSEKAFSCLQLATKTVSVCIAIAIVGAKYAQILGL